jgi:hypothetical protein
LLESLPEFAFIPSGHFLFGDQLRPSEPHYVWLTAYFISPAEVTNAEFKQFIEDPAGYRNDGNWSEAGRRWKATNRSQATALLTSADVDFKRFGQLDQPVVRVNWFEANAFCRWLTRKIGEGRWIFGLPSEAEWEKAARGPDNFDYGLGMNISDDEVSFTTGRKTPALKLRWWVGRKRNVTIDRIVMVFITCQATLRNGRSRSIALTTASIRMLTMTIAITTKRQVSACCVAGPGTQPVSPCSISLTAKISGPKLKRPILVFELWRDPFRR